jgi:DNA-binding transcriptional ArsR family regulator
VYGNSSRSRALANLRSDTSLPPGVCILGPEMTKTPLSREQLSRVLYAPNLNYFVAVTQSGSIREASRRLNISASAVSRQILELEKAVGVPLFERLGNKLRISAAGTVLLRHCTNALRGL